MIHRFPARFVYPSGLPPLLLNESAVTDCGCSVFVGLRVDTKEAMTVATPCSPDHTDLLERFNLALSDSLTNPGPRPLVEVCDEILDRIANSAPGEYTPPPPPEACPPGA